MPLPKDSIAFTDTLADIIRLPDETLAMSYIYLNKYKRFQSSSPTADPLDPYTLALATLSLASKATESPRRLRELLLPAHRLLHPPVRAQHDLNRRADRLSGPLKIPSEAYDVLRATLVQAELILLRVLGFELRVSSPMEYLARYLERAMEGVSEAGEDYEDWGKEERAEYGVVEGGWMGTGLGRGARGMAVVACKNYQLANLFPARAVALGCVYRALSEQGLSIEDDLAEWVDRISSGKVDVEDFREVMLEMGKS